MNLRLIFVALLGIASSSCVHSTLNQADISKMKSVLIYNGLENEFNLNEIGLTMFENEALTGDIKNWKLISSVEKVLEKTLPKSIEKVSFSDGHFPKSNRSNWDHSLTDAARKEYLDRNIDTLLIINKGGFYSPAGGGSHIVRPERGGFGLFTRSFLGAVSQKCVFFSYHINIYDVSSGKVLASTSKELCENDLKLPKTKPFNSYSEKENDLFREKLESYIREDFHKHLKSFLSPKQKLGAI